LQPVSRFQNSYSNLLEVFVHHFWVIPIECKILLLLCTHYECNVFIIFSLFLFWKKKKPTSNLLHPLHINTCWWHGWSAFLCV
jgi:hypothetical protein